MNYVEKLKKRLQNKTKMLLVIAENLKNYVHLFLTKGIDKNKNGVLKHLLGFMQLREAFDHIILKGNTGYTTIKTRKDTCLIFPGIRKLMVKWND